MNRLNRIWAVWMAAAALTVVVGCGKESDGGAGAESASASSTAGGEARCEHEIKRDTCPFCTPSLVESEGFCGEHGVAEALCAQCRPYLKAAFRVKGDWCAEHGSPDSQCLACHPDLEKNVKPGEHGVTTPAGHS